MGAFMTQSHSKYVLSLKGTLKVFLGFFFLCLLFSCKTTNLDYPKEYFIPSMYEWKEYRQGIWCADYTNKILPVKYHIVKIYLNSLENHDVVLYASPSDSINSISTKDFAKKLAKQEGVSIAINTTPFAKSISKTKQIVGIHKVLEKEYSPPVERYAALAFDEIYNINGRKGLRAFMLQNQKEDNLSYDYIFGAFYIILWQGIEQNFKTKSS